MMRVIALIDSQDQPMSSLRQSATGVGPATLISKSYETPQQSGFRNRLEACRETDIEAIGMIASLCCAVGIFERQGAGIRARRLRTPKSARQDQKCWPGLRNLRRQLVVPVYRYRQRQNYRKPIQ